MAVVEVVVPELVVKVKVVAAVAAVLMVVEGTRLALARCMPEGTSSAGAQGMWCIQPALQSPCQPSKHTAMLLPSSQRRCGPAPNTMDRRCMAVVEVVVQQEGEGSLQAWAHCM